METSLLSNEAKKEILNYMIKLAIPSVAVMGLILSLFSFLVQEYIATKTQMQIYDKSSAQVQSLLINVADAKSQADNARQRIIDTEKEVITLKQRIEIAGKEIDQLVQKGKQQSNLMGNDLTPQKIAQKVIESPSFASQIQVTKQSPVGSIATSIFNPVSFISKEMVDFWVPADGRLISKDSIYSTMTGVNRVPDLRGMFLRGLNEFEGGNTRKDGLEDPEGTNRKAGDYQEDKIKNHNHLVSSRTADTGSGGSKLPYRNGGNAGEWLTGVNADGGPETRPKNIAVYYYIKIN